MSNRRVRRISAFATGALLVSALSAGAEGSAAGVRWSVPRGWSAQPQRPMRVVTYTIPAARGAAPGECAVFYFGRGQGGTVADNLARWTQQFERSGRARRGERSIRGLRIYTIDLSGTYLAPKGPMMEPREKLPNYRLLGAIVETPDGHVFFKSTGPAATMEQARADFDRMIESVSKAAMSV
jgi:hypothetical protein